MTWTRGPDLLYARLYAACTIVGSTFIAWGGQDDSTVASATATPLIYDLNTNTYMTQFIPPPPHPSSSTTGTTSPASSMVVPIAGKSDKGHTGAIVGGLVGLMGLLGAVFGLLFYKRSRGWKMESNNSLIMNKLDVTTDEDPSAAFSRRDVFERVDNVGAKSTLTALSQRDPQSCPYNYHQVKDTGEHRAPQFIPDIYEKYAFPDAAPGAPQQIVPSQTEQ
ncbi:hypothetical protein EC968_003566 [Mortierella alpina]|nr:hypothetical protein EC968_003566 [Mortierella alpina]